MFSARWAIWAGSSNQSFQRIEKSVPVSQPPIKHMVHGPYFLSFSIFLLEGHSSEESLFPTYFTTKILGISRPSSISSIRLPTLGLGIKARNLFGKKYHNARGRMEPLQS
ncbi:unnamed protein product (mitochondrion) [Musa textilis]